MKRTISILLLALIAVSCNEEVYDPGTLSPKNKISIEAANFHPIGGTIGFTITAEEGWKVNGYDVQDNYFENWEWLSISKTSGGSGTTTVSLTAKAATEDVKAVISFEIDKENITLPFSQEKPMLKVVQDKESSGAIEGCTFEWYHGRDVVENESFVLKVDCNTDWKVEYHDGNDWRNPDKNDVLDWLYCKQVKSNSEKSKGLPVHFLPNAYNSTGEERSVKIRIKGYNDNKSEEFTLTQPGLRFKPNGPKVTGDGGSITTLRPCNIPSISMTVDSEVDWEVNYEVLKGTNTLELDPSDGEGTPYEDYKQVKITVPTNPSRNEQEFRINVIPKTGQYKDGEEISPDKSYTFTQRPYILEFEESEELEKDENYEYTLEELVNDDTESKRVTLESSGAWKVDESSVPDWIEFTSDISGKGSEYGDSQKIEMRFNAKTRNYDEKKRSETIIVKSTESGNELKTSLSVSQAEYILSQPPTEVKLNCTDDKNTPPHELSFDSSGKWRVEVVEYISGKKDWLEFGESEIGFTPVDKMTGNGNGTIYYRAKEANTSETDDNVAKVRLTSVTHEEGIENGETDKELYKEFTITHRKFVFNVEPNGNYQDDKFVFKAVVDDTKYYVDVDTSAAWEFVNNGNTWIQKGKEEDADGKKRVHIQVENNIESKPRTGTFTIRSTHDRSKTKTFNVEQGGYEWKIENIPTGTFPAVDVADQTIKVTCSGSWYITDPNNAQEMINNWSDLSEPQQSNVATLEINNNPNKQSRRAKFTIQSVENPNFKQDITLNQEAFEFGVVKKDHTAKLEFDALKPLRLTFSVTVSGNGFDYLNVAGLKKQLVDSGWFTDNNINVDADNKEITITPNENYKLESNELKLIFFSTIGDHKSEFELTQKAFEFDNKAEELSFTESLAPKPQSVTLEKSTGDWTVTKDQSWISVSPSEGSGSGEIAVTVEPYYTTDAKTSNERTGKVYIQSVYYDSNNLLRKQINVTQNVFKLVADETDVKLSSAKDSRDVVNITCSGGSGWTCEVSSGAEWLKAEKTGSSITISALSENTSTTTPRPGKIIVQTVDKKTDGTPLTLEISVEQAAATKK